VIKSGTYDVVILHPKRGLHTGAEFYIGPEPGMIGAWPHKRSVRIMRLTTSDPYIADLICMARHYETAMRDSIDYKSRVIGPGFLLGGVWGNDSEATRNCTFERPEYTMGIMYDQMMENPGFMRMDELKIVSKFIMDKMYNIYPKLNYRYGYAADDNKGHAICIGVGPYTATIWDSGPIGLTSDMEDENDHFRNINIADPSCGEKINEWLKQGYGREEQALW